MFEKAIDRFYVAVIEGSSQLDRPVPLRVEAYWVIVEGSRVFQLELRHEDGHPTFEVEVFECSGVCWPSEFLGSASFPSEVPMEIEHKTHRAGQRFDGWSAAYAGGIALIVTGVSTGRWPRQRAGR